MVFILDCVVIALKGLVGSIVILAACGIVGVLIGVVVTFLDKITKG